MIENDQQHGKPARLYQNTKANIVALGLGAGDEGCMAYATDTNEFGTFDGAAWSWGALPAVAAAGYVLVSDGVDSWAVDQTPLWTGEHSFEAGIAFVGASGANEITVPDNIVIALELLDAGGSEYMRVVSTNAQPATVFNFGEADIDFRVCGNNITNALFITGSTGFVAMGRGIPEGHLDVYDIAISTTISYYGIHNEHVKTLGATDHLDALEGIHNHIEFDQNGATIGYFTGINNRTILTSGSVGDGGARDMKGIFNYLWMEDATCTITDDVHGVHTYIDLNGGTIGGDITGHSIYMNLRAGLTSIGGDVFGINLYLDADTDPVGTVYSVYWEEGTNVDYGIYQNGTAPNLLGGRLGVGRTPSYKFDVEENRASHYAAHFYNDGDNVNRYGMVIQCGADNGAAVGTTYYILAVDGNGGATGHIKTINGVFQLADVSDEQRKTNIEDTKLIGLDIINGLRVRDYNWKANPRGPMMTSFVAQEAQEVFPAMISEDEDGLLTTSRAMLIPVLTKAIQELDARLTRLEVGL